MNEVASILGIYLPTFNSRDAVMRVRFHYKDSKRKELSSVFCYRNSLLIGKKSCDANDDDTACTASSSECGGSIDAPNTVSFAENLVTEIHTRPYTTICERQKLFYCDWEYLEFRRDAYGLNRRERLVKFSDDVVSKVWIIPTVEDPSLMHYSEKELQSFLDEFISSLQKK